MQQPGGIPQKGVLKNFENFQENTPVGVSFLIKLHSVGAKLYQKQAPAQAFPCIF